VAQSQNRLLASLPSNAAAVIRPHLKRVELKLGDVLSEAGSVIKRVYFPNSGIISLVVELSAGQMIETAMVGRDGVLHAASALGGIVSPNKSIVRLAGAASVIGADQIRKIADKIKFFRSILTRHDQALFAQSQQSAACNASHSIEARLCRWLLRMRDLLGREDLSLKQEVLAQMLGVQRSSVSMAANTLQKAGFIKYHRGNIRIIDLRGLKKGSFECYATVKAHYKQLIG
jgi:CRP-like cAMP-binding protein